MPVRSFALQSFEDIMLLRPGLLEEGSVPWLLRDHSGVLFPAWLFAGWKGESSTGREAWPARTLMGMLLLRYVEEGLTRVGSVRRAATDAVWRAALRLPWNEDPPQEKTLREFEAFLKTKHPGVGVPRILVLFEHWTRLCLDRAIVGEAATWVIDSTPMWCFGAVLDTVNLVGEGLRALARGWARARGVPLNRVAAEWDAPLLLAKSTKGHFEGTDWADTHARSEVLVELMETVGRCVGIVTDGLFDVRENKRVSLARRCKTLLRVVEEDLETAEDGTVQVAVRTTSKRLISLTDPDAQHFRKSASKVCSGFKLHVLGDAISGLIAALSVTPGGDHDSTQAAPLISRAKALWDKIDEVLGDSAYGGTPVRAEVAQATGVTLFAPPPKLAPGTNALGKADFGVDFVAMIATCPGGVATGIWKLTKRDGGQMGVTFTWSKADDALCTCAESCPVHRRRPRKDGKTDVPSRRLALHPDEQELRRLRAEWQRPEVRLRYRQRSPGERLINEMTRRGARHANAWGLSSAELQAYCVAAVNNLRLLAKRLASDHANPRAVAA